MSNAAQAAVLWPDRKDFSIESVVIEDPRPGEVLVKVVASGICHTDLVLRDMGVTARPVVLGHEGSGIVEKVGEGVTEFKAGDRVGMSFASCGECPSCRKNALAYCHEFFPLNFMGNRRDGSSSLSKNSQKIGSHVFGQSSFATRAICSPRNLVKVDDSVPLELVGPFGCGLQTGAGAVLNSLKVQKGASVMVLGAGVVGLAAVMAAANIAEANRVIAVDLHAARLEVASSVGATHVVSSASGDLAKQIREICPAGVDYIFDTTGHLPLVEECIELLAIQGTLGMIASYAPGKRLSFDAVMFMITGKKIQGVVEGDSDIKTFIPQLLDYYKRGLFPIEKIVRFYDLADINQAVEDAERGETIKAVVRMS